MHIKKPVTIFWFRRDLRLNDNAGLYYALKENKNVLPVFIFDTTILDKLENKKDRRVDFIYQALEKLKEELELLKTSLLILYDTPLKAFERLLKDTPITAVYTNEDYEPSAIKRDNAVQQLLNKDQIEFKTYKDQIIFEKNEVTKDDGLPYSIFTPYMNKWKSKLTDFYLKSYPTKKYFSHFFPVSSFPFPTLEEIGFESTGYEFHSPRADKKKIAVYDKQRDFPGIAGTTHLGVHLRFGTVSIRHLAAVALETNQTWLSELIWREFFMQILFHFPHVEKNSF
ncbi:MAG TPA: deoxyribodipyrimidine photo-lyase, partial [Bacteroidia bacterium]|nr:deoxyribodipyrimidine photo-lyase [Bacteroidia bacterium]